MDDTIPRLTELVTSASWRVRRGTAKELEPFGITPAQARVLRIVGGAPAPLRMADLAERLDVVPRSATTMIDALESAGLVERRPDTTDRRSIRLVVTNAGAACSIGSGRGARPRPRSCSASSPRAEQEELARMLERVLDDERPRRGRWQP